MRFKTSLLAKRILPNVLGLFHDVGSELEFVGAALQRA